MNSRKKVKVVSFILIIFVIAVFSFMVQSNTNLEDIKNKLKKDFNGFSSFSTFYSKYYGDSEYHNLIKVNGTDGNVTFDAYCKSNRGNYKRYGVKGVFAYENTSAQEIKYTKKTWIPEYDEETNEEIGGYYENALEDYYGRVEQFGVDLKIESGSIKNLSIEIPTYWYYDKNYNFDILQTRFSTGDDCKVSQRHITQELANKGSINAVGYIWHKDKVIADDVYKNIVKLTGIYVSEDGEETKIDEYIPLYVEWKGNTELDILNNSQTQDVESAIDEENETFTVNFELDCAELLNNTYLNSSEVYVDVPDFNGMEALSTSITNFDKKIEKTIYASKSGDIWDEETEDGTRISKYNVEVVYPLEAFKNFGDDTVNLRFNTYSLFSYKKDDKMIYYNNKFDFVNVHYNKITTSDEKYDLKVGKRVYENDKWIVSKDKPLRIYNGRSIEENNDNYTVRWYVNPGEVQNENGLVIKAQALDQFVKSDTTTISIENGTVFRGIYFNNQENVLGEDGWIRVYNDDTDELLVMFANEEYKDVKSWFNYTVENPYIYDVATRNIRIETSKPNSNAGLYVYNVKELYDEYITQNYTKEEFNEFEYIKSTFSTYLGEEHLNTSDALANYEMEDEEEPEENINSTLSLKLIKTEKDTENKLANVKYKITGKGYNDGRIITTNNDGEVLLTGLYLNEEYILEEKKAEGYYLSNPVIFKVEDGAVDIIDGNFKNVSLDSSTVIPMAVIELEDEKIPTYTLQLEKIKRVIDVELSEDPNNTGNNIEEVEHLSSAEFKLYKNGVDLGNYITNSDGLLTIDNLYLYDYEKGVDQTYKLKEIKSPSGYSKIKDITFRVEENNGNLEFIETLQEGQSAKNYTANGSTVKIVVEDAKAFKLINKDAETGELLSNTKFAFYNVDGEPTPARNGKNEIVGTLEEINGEEWYVVNTDENGEIILDLIEGLYKAIEVEAPEKYDISKAVYYFGIATKDNLEKIDYKIETLNEKAIGNCSTVSVVNDDQITSVIETQNGIVAIGVFDGVINTLENGTELQSNGEKDGMIIYYDQYGNILWTKVIGGIDDDYLNAVCETQDNGIVVAGTYKTGLTLSNGTILSNNGSTDGMIIKYDENGIIKWSKSIGGTGEDNLVTAIETQNGDIVVGGYFENSLTIDGETVNCNGYTDGILIKLNANGELQWVKTMGDEYSDYINDIIEIENSDIVIGGSITTDNEIGYSSKGIVSRYDSDGNLQWSHSPENYFSIDVINKTNSNEIIACSASGELLKYDKNGKLKWEKQVTPEGYSGIMSVFESQDNGIVIGGYLGYGSPEEWLTVNQSVDGLVVKTDKNGNIEWMKNLGGDGNDCVSSVYEKSTGEIIVGGCFSNNIEFESGNSFSTIGTSGILFELSIKELVSKPKAEVTLDVKDSIDSYVIPEDVETIATSDGGMITCGDFLEDELDFGNDVIIKGYTDDSAQRKGRDIFIVKYNSDGEAEWAKSIVGNNYQYINSICETNDGGFLVAGEFDSDYLYIDNYSIKNKNTNTSFLTYDGMLIKYSSAGEVEWAKSYGKTNYDSANEVVATSDGGFAVIVTLTGKVILKNGELTYIEDDSSNYETYVIKYNNKRTIEWIDNIEESEIYSIIETSDNGIVIAGGILEEKSIENSNARYACSKKIYI